MSDLFGNQSHEFTPVIAGIPLNAITAEPMTTSEIDQHPDSARIWATVSATRFTMIEEVQAERDIIEEDAEEAGFDKSADQAKSILEKVNLTYEVDDKGEILITPEVLTEGELEDDLKHLLELAIDKLCDKLNAEYEF